MTTPGPQALPGYPPLYDSYHVIAERWRDGWELYVGDVGVTCTSESDGRAKNADAEHMVRDFLATTYDLSDDAAAALTIEITYHG